MNTDLFTNGAHIVIESPFWDMTKLPDISTYSQHFIGFKLIDMYIYFTGRGQKKSVSRNYIWK